MIVMTTRFPLPANTDWRAQRSVMAERISLYADVNWLRSKAMFLDSASCEFGAPYVWEDRPSMDSFLASDIYNAAVERFGPPDVVTHEVVALLEHGAVVNTEPAGR